MFAPPTATPSKLTLAALVAGGWLLVTVLYHAGVAAIIPFLLLIGTAALIRGGRTILDRIVLATGLLLGLTCLGALVFAVWPWGLHPIAVGGTAMTALILMAVRNGRMAFPKPTAKDAVAAAATTAVAAILGWPLLSDGRAGRIARILDGEDMARHAALFDAIRRGGGYLFQTPELGRSLVYEGMITYPQGEHLTAALLDGFLRSDGSQGSGPEMLDHYLLFVTLGYVLLTVTLLWAAQWIGAGRLTAGKFAPIAAGIALLCGFGELLELVRFGYPSQVLGLAEAVLLLALLVRPLPRPRQQLLLVAALLVAVGFTYYLYLPPVGLAVILWIIRDKRHRRVPATALAIAVTSAVPLAIGVLVAGQAKALLSVGSLVVGKEGLAVLTCLVASGIVTRRGRASRIWRSYALVFVPVAGFAFGMLVVQKLFGGGSGYYANKALFLVLALLIAGAGALALHLPRVKNAHAASVLMAVVALVSPASEEIGNQGTDWVAGAGPDYRFYAEVLLKGGPTGPTVVVGDDPGYDSYKLTLFLSMLQRTSGQMAAATYHLGPINAPGRLDAVVTRVPGPMRILAITDDAAVKAEELRRRHPAATIEVVRL